MLEGILGEATTQLLLFLFRVEGLKINRADEF